MGQITIDTLNKIDRDNAMVALHAIALSNGEDLLFCPINEYNEQVGKFKELNSVYQKCKEDRDFFEVELTKETEKNNNLLEANNSIREKNEEFQREKEELTSKVKELNEKLSKFTFGYDADGKCVLLFFKPEKDKLIQTTNDTALFVGVAKDGVIEYQFNDEKGIHQKAIQNKNDMLIPFCDIEHEAPEANYIENKDKGSFSLNGGEFKMIKKAIINIVVK